MILGIGVDICQIERIRRSLSGLGDAWIDHLFSRAERALCEVAADPALLFARGFCGKEACAKALGTGVADGVDWRDIEVLQSLPETVVRLSGGTLDRLKDMIPIGYEASVHVTCSGDRRLAQALVVVSATHKAPVLVSKFPNGAPIAP